MGTLALLVDGEKELLSLGSGATSRLCDLGITRVIMFRDHESVAFVLDGWAFDPEASAKQAEEALLGVGCQARRLYPVAQVNLLTTSAIDEPTPRGAVPLEP